MSVSYLRGRAAHSGDLSPLQICTGHSPQAMQSGTMIAACRFTLPYSEQCWISEVAIAHDYEGRFAAEIRTATNHDFINMPKRKPPWPPGLLPCS